MGFSYYQAFVKAITSKETDPINQSRLKVLFYCLTSNLIFVCINVFIYFFEGQELQFYRTLVALVFAVFMLFAIWKWPIWQQVSHLACLLITLMVWSNLLFYIQGVNLPTIQFVFLIMVYSYYIHGLKWGVFYSFLNVLPVLFFGVFNMTDYFSVHVPPQIISKPAYLFVVTYNFFLIIFLHYHLFKSYNINILKITKAKNHLDTVNNALEQAMIEVEKSSKMKLDFLSTMSHELRTPLNGVIGLSNVILMENPRADQKDNLDILKFSAENLLALINDILDLNKLDSQKIELEKISFYLTDLLKNSSGSLKLTASNKGLDFYVKVTDQMEDKLIYSDPTRLTQVITNLVNNAVKFTDTGFVKLETEILAITKDTLTVRFSVEDSGIGIDQDKQAAIFEPFIQASKSTTRQFGGTGLGLPIVKRILRMFNSDIFVESSAGIGTRFWFDIHFPYKTQQPQQNAECKVQRDGLKGLKVLVAEDNMVNIFVIKKMLTQWGINPVIAENGNLAVNLVKEQDFDIILMDLHMPVMDGYQATAKIRQLDDDVKAKVPIIALTASVSSAVGSKVVEIGMDDYLSKPFNPDKLYEKLAYHVFEDSHAIRG